MLTMKSDRIARWREHFDKHFDLLNVDVNSKLVEVGGGPPSDESSLQLITLTEVMTVLTHMKQGKVPGIRGIDDDLRSGKSDMVWWHFTCSMWPRQRKKFPRTGVEALTFSFGSEKGTNRPVANIEALLCSLFQAKYLYRSC